MLVVRVLGQFAARLFEAPVELPLRSAQSLLAYLMLTAGTEHRRERLAALFWPEATEAGARQSLRQALWQLRRALAGAAETYLLADPQDISFNPNAEYWLDAAVLQQALGPQTPTDEWVRVVSAYGGELLPGFYDDWVSLEREHLAAVFERQMQGLLERLAADQAWNPLVEWAEQWLAFGQVPEPAYRALMLGRAGLGDLAGVAAAYQRCRADLARELAVEPSDQTRALFEQLQRGQPAAFAAAPAAGLEQRYQLQGEIGRGGMGVVHKAHDRLLDRDVAVKLLSSSALGTSGQARLLREAQAAARLQHPNIVSVYDVGELTGTPAIFMELVDGPTLERQPPTELDAVLRIGRDVAAALAHAHAHGVLHRDIKPGNIVLGGDGTPKLMDFGLAFLPAAARLTQAEQPAGTVLYMAPELLRGEAPTPQTDLYALGATLYELATGQPPFDGEDLPAIISQHLHAPVVPPSRRQGQVPAALDDLIVRLLSKAPADRPASAAEVGAILERLARGEDVAPDAPAPGEPPYRGLQHFDEADAEWFFGREQLVARLTGRLREERLLVVVVGASGSGKSSVVRAGIVPALRRDGPLADSSQPPSGSSQWPIHIITPTAHPLEALAASLTAGSESVTAQLTLMDDLAADARSLHAFVRRRVGHAAAPEQRLLVVVDQFEELFTLCRDEDERQAFIDNLLQAAAPETGGPTVVVLTLRADFYTHCAAYPSLREALVRFQEFIGPMSPAELRRAIEAPAERGGWRLEGGLVELLLKDVGDEPGALPLLSHALLETWQRRRGRTLTVQGYTEAGGVRGAIAQTAETVLARLSPAQQAIARNIFLRLTELGEGTQDTRRRAERVELFPRPEDAAEVETVLQVLSEARLITAGLETVEVAHEALIREWPTLQRWLAEDRDGLRLHRHLTEAAHDWQQRDRDPAELYRGARLAQAWEWAQFSGRGGDLNVLEREFLAVSKAEAERDAAEREAQRQREIEAAQQAAEANRQIAESAQRLAQTEQQRAREQASTSRRLRRLALGLAVLLVVAVGAGGLAVQQSQRAERDAHLARAHEWAAEAVNQIAIDPERSIWFALYALEEARAAGETELPQAEEALHQAVQAVRIQLTLPHDYRVLRVRFSADGVRLVTVDDRAVVRVWDLTAPDPAAQPLFQFALPRQEATTPILEYGPIELSADGSEVLLGDDHTAKIWDVGTGQLVQTLEGNPNDRIVRLALSPDGSRLAVKYTAIITIWDTITGEELRSFASGTILNSQMAFSPNGARLAVATDAGQYTIVYDVESGREVMRLWGGPEGPFGVSYSPTGQYLATGGYDRTIRLWDADSGEQVMAYEATQTGTLAFSPNGRQLAAGIVVWEAGAGRRIFELKGHTNFVADLAYSPDGTRLASASADQSVKVWDATPAHEWSTLRSPATAANSSFYAAEFNPANDQGQLLLAAGGQDKLLRGQTGEVRARAMLWDVAQDRLLWQASVFGLPVGLSFSPDGAQLVVAEYGHVSLMSTEAGVKTSTLPAPADPLGVAFYPDGTRVAYADCDGRLLVWDLAKREYAFRVETVDLMPAGCPWWIRIKVSGDGRLLAAAGPDHQVRLFDANSGEQLHVLTGHQEQLYGLALSADGTLLAAGSEDATITVWDVASATLLYRLTGHIQGITGLAFSPDGEMLASSDWDGLTKLWDLDSQQERLTLYHEDTSAYSVTFSPDGKFLAVAGDAVRIFLPRAQDLVALARDRLTRSLSTEECQQFLRLDACPDSSGYAAPLK